MVAWVELITLCWAWRLLWCFHRSRRRLKRCWSFLLDVEKRNLLCKEISHFFCQKLEPRIQIIFVALCMTDTNFIVSYFLMSFWSLYGGSFINLISWELSTQTVKKSSYVPKLSCIICFLRYSACLSHIVKGRMAAVQQSIAASGKRSQFSFFI